MAEEKSKTPLAEAVRAAGFNRVQRASGLSASGLSRTVKGETTPKPKTAEHIAEALEMSVDEIEWPRGIREPEVRFGATTGGSDEGDLLEGMRDVAEAEALNLLANLPGGEGDGFAERYEAGELDISGDKRFRKLFVRSLLRQAIDYLGPEETVKELNRYYERRPRKSR